MEINRDMEKYIREAMQGRSVSSHLVAIANAFMPALKKAAPSLSPEQAEPLFTVYNRHATANEQQVPG